MKRYVAKLALLLLLLTLLIPGSLPTATAAPSNNTVEEYHPGVGAKLLRVYSQEVTTMYCGNLPPSICVPDGPNDPEDQEKLIYKRILPAGTTIEKNTVRYNPPVEHFKTIVCGTNTESWRTYNSAVVDLVLTYPSEFDGGRSFTIAGYREGLKEKFKETGLWTLPPDYDCKRTVQGTWVGKTVASGRYTLTDAPDKDGDKVANKYDACPSQPGPASSDGCPSEDKEEKPERCATHTHRIPATFTDVGLDIQYGWFRVERRVCFNNIRVTKVTQSQVFLDLPDAIRALNILSLNQIQFVGSYEPWEGHPEGALNTFWQFSIRLSTPEVRIPGFRIPFTEERVGSFTLPAYNGEIERPAIRIISLANGCYYASPGGGNVPICPSGSYE